MTEYMLNSVFALVGGGVGAYFASYLRKRGELRAVEEKLSEHTRIQSQILESTRGKWSKRCEIIAELFGLLNDIYWKFRRRTTGAFATAEEMEDLRTSRQAFDDYFLRSVVFLPEHIEQQFNWISLELLDISSDLGSSPEELDTSVQQHRDEAEHHGKARRAAHKRLNGGDIESAVNKLKSNLRRLLDGELN